MNSVGARIRQARLARGLTQEQLGRGVATKGFISQVERDLSVPSFPKLRVLADRLGIPISQITGEAPPQELLYLRKSAELAIRAGEPARALEIVAEALPLASTSSQLADLHRVSGLAHDALGQYDQALATYQLAAATVPAGEPGLAARIYAEMGTVLQIQELFNAAIEADLRALDWLGRSPQPDASLRARLLTNLGGCSYGLGQIEQADRYSTQALAAATEGENLLRLANAHMALGITARAQGDLDRAIEHNFRALELHTRLKEHRDANIILNNLGDVHFAAGRLAQARELQQRSLEGGRRLKDPMAIALAACELARYALVDGTPKQTLEFARESQQAARKVSDHLHEALSIAFEASALERQGHPDRADRRFRTALNLLSQRKAAGKLAEVCVIYGDILRARGEIDLAFALFRVASERDFAHLGSILGPGSG